MGNRQRAVRGACLRLDIIAETRAGFSNEVIAQKHGVTTTTVNRHQRRFLETDAKYPTNLTPEDAAMMRAEHRDILETALRDLIQTENSLSVPTTFAQEIKVFEIKTRVKDSEVRILERLSKLHGLDAVAEKGGTTTNTQINLQAPTLELLARFNEIQREKRLRVEPTP